VAPPSWLGGWEIDGGLAQPFAARRVGETRGLRPRSRTRTRQQAAPSIWNL